MNVVTSYGLVGKKLEELIGKLFKCIKHKVMKVQTGVIIVETERKSNMSEAF